MISYLVFFRNNYFWKDKSEKFHFEGLEMNKLVDLFRKTVPKIGKLFTFQLIYFAIEMPISVCESSLNIFSELD